MSNARKIAFPSKLAYGVGQLAEGLKNHAFGAFALFYYSQVLDVPASWCGAALGIALLFDAVTDPLAGSLSDHWHSPRGRRHPFMYASALPLAFCFFALFSPPDLGTTGLVIWLTVFSILTRGAMTLYHVPHIALGAELTQDFEERTSIVAFRQGFGYTGALLSAMVAFLWYFSDANGGRVNADAYPEFAAVLAVAMAVTILWSAWGTRKEIPFLPKPTHSDEGSVLGRMTRDTRDAFSNGSFPWLFAGVLIVFVMVGVNATLDIYLFQYFWELESRQFLFMYMIMPIGLVLGTPLVAISHRRFDKKPSLVFGTGGWAVLQLTPIILRLAGWFPENGDPALLYLLLVFRFFQGVIVQQALVSFGSMMADVADEHELETGKRTEGIFFGAVSFSGKGASGFGTLIAGIGLDVIAFPRGPDIQTAADVPPDALYNLGILYGPVVAGFAIVSVWCYTRYRLDRRRHAEILVELAKRRDERRHENKTATTLTASSGN